MSMIFWNDSVFNSHLIKLSTVPSTIVILHSLSFAMSGEEFLTSDIENEDDEDDELVIDERWSDGSVPKELKGV